MQYSKNCTKSRSLTERPCFHVERAPSIFIIIIIVIIIIVIIIIVIIIIIIIFFFYLSDQINSSALLVYGGWILCLIYKSFIFIFMRDTQRLIIKILPLFGVVFIYVW